MAVLLRKLKKTLLASAPSNSGERRCAECSGVNGNHKDDCSFNPKNW